jgi:hypothetical protein
VGNDDRIRVEPRRDVDVIGAQQVVYQPQRKQLPLLTGEEGAVGGRSGQGGTRVSDPRAARGVRCGLVTFSPSCGTVPQRSILVHSSDALSTTWLLFLQKNENVKHMSHFVASDFGLE